MTNCPHCGCPIPDRLAECPNCGIPKAPPVVGAPPPFTSQVPPQDDDVTREVKAVSRFGSIMTASFIALLVLIVMCGAGYAAVMGCLGACGAGLNNGRAPASPPNPFIAYVGPIVGGLIAMWVILTIVILVIRRRRKP